MGYPTYTAVTTPNLKMLIVQLNIATSSLKRIVQLIMQC